MLLKVEGVKLGMSFERYSFLIKMSIAYIFKIIEICHRKIVKRTTSVSERVVYYYYITKTNFLKNSKEFSRPSHLFDAAAFWKFQF